MRGWPRTVDEIPWNDPAEQLVGRITRAGRWDRRYRQAWRVEPVPPPDPMIAALGVLVGIAVMLLVIVGVLTWVAIAQGAR